MLLNLLIFAITLHHTLSDVVVQLPNGQIQGRKDISLNRNVSFYAFQQIPYGEPPLGKLRFMSPKPVGNWEGILDCTKNTKYCYQVKINDNMESEDCLYLNVYTPVDPGSNSSLPVMFYIYGGGFEGGNAFFSNVGPHFLMEEGVVVVTVFYRVGPLGFLSTNDEVVSGNNGLKDQNLALKWTQENIHLFGGDPNKVTIFGQSAGAASVSYQILSKQSTGLFRAAIGQSGSSISPWAYQRYARAIAYQLATIIDPHFSYNSSSLQLLDFLQSVNASLLDQASELLRISLDVVGNEQIVEGFYFSPVIESNSVEDAFITESMHESIANGRFNQIPIILGICSEEELGRAQSVGSFKQVVETYENDTSLLVINDFHINNVTEKHLVGNLTREIYTDGLFADNLAAAVKYFSDTSFSRSVIRHAQLQSNYTDVYFYQFSYNGELGDNNIYLEGADRVKHAEDNRYLWISKNISNVVDYYPQSDVTTLERFVRLFTNFAKYLNPTPEPEDLLQNITWPKFVANNSQYLNINNSLEIEINPKDEPYRKWVDLYDNYAIRPYDTY